MSTPKLDDALRAYYQDASLDPAVLRRWTSVPPERSRRGLVLAAVAMVAGAAMLALWPSVPAPIEQRIAEYVWAHHRAPETLEVTADTIEAIGARLERLDFALMSSSALAALTPQGGRHCTLEGRVAARVDLADDQGRRHTLYVTRNDDRFRQVADATVDMSEGRVRVWKEHGLVYALASSNG